MRQLILGSAILLFVLIPSSAARAKRAALTPLGPLGISAKETRTIELWIEQAAQQLPDYRWAPSDRLTRWLHRPAHAQCLTERRCLRSLAHTFAVREIVAGDVGSVGDAYAVYLRVFTARGDQRRSAHAVIDPRQTPQLSARMLLYRLLLPTRYVGAIEVHTDVSNSWIYLDGRRVARGPSAVIPDLSVGQHALRITHESYRDMVRFVRVDFGKTTQVRAELSKFTVPASGGASVPDDRRPLTSSELPWYRRWWAVTTFGVLLLAATTAAVAAIPRSASRDLESTVVPP